MRQLKRLKSGRDFQRSKVYLSEKQAIPEIYKQEFLDFVDVMEFAEKVKCSDHWKKHKGWQRVKVLAAVKHQRRGLYWSQRKTVTLPEWAWNRQVILHELAHALTHKTHPEAPAHGKFFCNHYLELIFELMPEENGNNLMDAFNTNGVNY